MALLLGYSANASAIVLPGPEDTVNTPPFSNLRAAVLFFLVARAVRLILYVAYALYLPNFRLSILATAFGASPMLFHNLHLFHSRPN